MTDLVGEVPGQRGAAEPAGVPPGDQGAPVEGRQSVIVPTRPSGPLRPGSPTAWVLAAVVAVLVAYVVVFGAIIAVHYPLWSPVDEGAHYDYVQVIAQDHTLPVLGKTYTSEQVLALSQGLYPGHTTIDARTYGLAGLSYEAFQPPLYYVLAVPAFDLSANYHTKAILLRFFDLGLMVVAIALFARLCRVVLRDQWLVGMAAGMVVFAFPGMVVRGVIISNLPLEIPLTIACVTELWIAVTRRSPSRLVVAGILMGLAILTDLFGLGLIALYVPAAVLLLWPVWRDRSARLAVAVRAASGALIGFVLVLPWLVFNEVHYHSLTASSLAKAEQEAIVNPHHLHFGLTTLADQTVTWLTSPVLPQEWNLGSHAVALWVMGLLTMLVVPFALLVVASMGRVFVTSGCWMLVVPWVAEVVICWGITLGAQWDTMLSRYTYPGLPILALAMALGATRLVRSALPVALTAALSTVGLLLIWVRVFPQIHTS